jgi:hypothetical protein
MTQIVLTRLWEMQDETIEHKLINYSGPISYFIEAAGDIYRELCHEPVDYSYIAEKRKKLRNFYTLPTWDIKEIGEKLSQYPDWYEQIDLYILKVDALRFETEKFDFGIYTKSKVYGEEIYLDRKERMLEALRVTLSVCFYAKDEMKKEEVENMIKIFESYFEGE